VKKEERVRSRSKSAIVTEEEEVLKDNKDSAEKQEKSSNGSNFVKIEKDSDAEVERMVINRKLIKGEKVINFRDTEFMVLYEAGSINNRKEFLP
jgi:hypothetical protein